ncbi:hypothetical protein H9W90_09330 [Polaribacter pectinis]|uniref:MORN repeat protein n=1 Tax=Polaribacter pectinis TaxID=2738844 RepID=A0A7G9LEP5_9FLAO|nr:hypothetical protein H9W90_09330 [Polaribacter pectinis]
MYLGNWSNDLRNGFGTILDNKGKIIFEGEWKNDKMIPSKNK